jgi:hypothetical protein
MMQSQKVKIISRRLPLKYLVVGAVMLLGGGAYSLWQSFEGQVFPIHTPATKPTKPAIIIPKVQIAMALGYLEPRSEMMGLLAHATSARNVAGLTNLHVTGEIDDIDIT